MSSGTGRSGALLLVAVVEMVPGAAEAGREYEDAVLALLGRHDGWLERRMRSADAASEVSEVHVIRFGSRAGYESFMADPDRLRLRAAAGDEILTLLSGELELVLDVPGGEQRATIKPGETFIVPKGVWHRGIVRAPGRLMFITPGAGTEHKPV